MTSKQRINDLLAGKKVDKLPNLTIVGALPTRLVNQTIGKWCQDENILAEAAVMAAEKFHLDYYQVQSDTYREAVDYGCKIEYMDDKLPAVHSPIILSTKDALQIKPLQVENAPRILQTVRTVEKLSSYQDKYMMPLVMGPLSVLGSLRDVSHLMTDFYDDLDMVVSLLEILVETQKNFIKAIIDAGSSFIYIADPVASLVSPDYFREYVLPSLQSLIQYANGLGAKVRLHICGNTTNILPYTSQSGADILDIDHPVDFGKACELSKGYAIINGNLNPVNEVFSSQPANIIQAVQQRFTWANQNPCMIMPGCELPANTPFENVLAIHEGLLTLH